MKKFVGKLIFSIYKIVKSVYNAFLKHPAISEAFNSQYDKEKLSRSETGYQTKNRKEFASLFEHEKMLADRPRVDSYYAGIKKYVCPGDRIIDLGTGTGILSFMASQVPSTKIYALDHSEILNLARKLAADNHITNVEFVNTHSSEFSLPEKVDVILQEQMGDFLFNEYMIPNVCDLRDRLLKMGGKILPALYDFYIEPVKVVDKLAVPFIWQQKVHGVDFSGLREVRIPARHYYRIYQFDPGYVDYFLGSPKPVYSFDLNTLQPDSVPQEFSYSRPVRLEGRLDGFIVYFDCKFDEKIKVTNGPFPDRATNWAFYLLRVENCEVHPGDQIQFKITSKNWADVNSWQWEYSLAPQKEAIRS